MSLHAFDILVNINSDFSENSFYLPYIAVFYNVSSTVKPSYLYLYFDIKTITF